MNPIVYVVGGREKLFHVSLEIYFKEKKSYKNCKFFTIIMLVVAALVVLF
jgi:hypothetical protein